MRMCHYYGYGYDFEDELSEKLYMCKNDMHMAFLHCEYEDVSGDWFSALHGKDRSDRQKASPQCESDDVAHTPI